MPGQPTRRALQAGSHLAVLRPVNRVLLALIFCLGALLAASRLSGLADPAPISAGLGPAIAAVDRRPALRPAVVPVVAPPGEPVARTGTPLIAQLARLEAKRRLGFSGRYTYLDSMLVFADSMIRRWPGRDGDPLRVVVYLPDHGPSGRRLAELVMKAFTTWEHPALGIRFANIDDSLHADIVVGWVDHFPPEVAPDGAHLTGLTSLIGNGKGELQLARIQLALGDGRGRQLSDDEMRLVTLHEIGHALGLPHSGERSDIMYPTVLANQLSDRDRATLTLLYSLPPGPLREPASP